MEVFEDCALLNSVIDVGPTEPIASIAMTSDEIRSIGVVPRLVEVYAADGLFEQGNDGLTLNEYDPVFPSLGEYLTEILTVWIEVVGMSGKSIILALAMAERTYDIVAINRSDWRSETVAKPGKSIRDGESLTV
jgi:hypothetical protein